MSDMLEGHIERPVLIGVAEFIKEPEGGGHLLVRSMVRLRALDPCLRLTGEGEDSFPPLHFKLFGSSGDGELESSDVGRRVKAALVDGNRVDDIIERGPEIVDTVARDQGPAIQRGRICDFDDKAIAGTIRIVLFGDGIGATVAPVGQLGIVSIEMFF